jgi:uncharacterized protein (DUF885 family)
MNRIRRQLGRVAVALVVTASVASAASWVERSNEAARPLIEAVGPFEPVSLDFFGVPGFTENVPDAGPNGPERYRAALQAAQEKLKVRLAAESDTRVRQDIEMMIHAAATRIEGSALNERYLLPFDDVGKTIFEAISHPLTSRPGTETAAKLYRRLQRFVGKDGAREPYAVLIRARYEEAAKEDPSRLAPFKRSVEDAIANSSRYVEGVKQSLDGAGIQDTAEVYAALDAQLGEYYEWVRQSVLPRARPDFRDNRELYAMRLREIGVDIAPEALISQAALAFAEIRNEMATLAAIIAEQRKLPSSDYPDVFRALKKEQLASAEVLPVYNEVVKKIEAAIVKERICSLPERELQIKIASEAESAAQPAPHLLPPPIINNTGQRGTFMLPLGNPNSEAADGVYDDFTYKAVAWTLTAHEGRPGHELQFSSMVERGVSLARSLFAFNSVNVEGWALYAEAELKPYEPLEGQLAALQFRLLRAARAMLDPMLNLGLITPERAEEVLEKEVVLSKPMCRQEMDRYMFNMPGQATSYFYGYLRLMQLRATTELALPAGRFDRKAFNDFVLDQGLLPPDLLAAAVRNEFIPAVQKASSKRTGES